MKSDTEYFQYHTALTVARDFRTENQIAFNFYDILSLYIHLYFFRQKEIGICPVCNSSFEVNVLEAHAAGCGIDTIRAGGSERYILIMILLSCLKIL
jgi:hypothetical protein